MNILTHCNRLCRSSDPFRTGTIAESAWPIAMPTQLQRQTLTPLTSNVDMQNFGCIFRHLRLNEYIYWFNFMYSSTDVGHPPRSTVQTTQISVQWVASSTCIWSSLEFLLQIIADYRSEYVVYTAERCWLRAKASRLDLRIWTSVSGTARRSYRYPSAAYWAGRPRGISPQLDTLPLPPEVKLQKLQSARLLPCV